MNKQHSINEDSFSKWKSPDFSEKVEIVEEADIEASAYEVGYQAGLKNGSDEINAQINILTQYLDTISRVFDDQNQLLVEYLVQLSGDIAKAIVKKELSTDPELILTIVRDTVSALNGNNSEILIHLNPKSATCIRQLINENEKERYWKIIDDPLVEMSDCKISSQYSLIDTNIESRIELIVNQLLDDSRNKELE